MIKNNLYRWEPTNLQINKIILPAYTDLYKRCVSYINDLDCSNKYIADKSRDLAEAIMTPYPEFKGNTSDL